MKQKLFLLAVILLPFISNGQNAPTLMSYAVDTVCENAYGYGVYNLVVEDLDNDSTYIEIVNYDNLLIWSVYVYGPDIYNPGSSLRTFKIEIGANSGLPAGVSLSNIDINIVGGPGDSFSTPATLNNIGVRQGPTVTTDFSAVSFCSNGNPVDPSPYVSPVGGLIYYNDGSSSPLFDPELFYADPGDGIVYTYTDAYGCSDSQMEYVAVSNAPTVTVNANSSSCGNADGSAIASILGDAMPFDVYWTTGFSESTTSSSIVNNLASGNYYVNVTDANGCKAVGIAQISDGDLDVTETVTDETCINQSFDGAIDLNVLSTNGTVDYIFWNTGATTEDISGLKAGDYTVQIHTTMNCQGYYTFTVGALPALSISVDNVLPADCNASDGGNSAIEITSYGGSGSYSWSWNTGDITEDIYQIPVGIYTCVITDQVTGCSWSWTKNLESFNGPSVYTNQVTQSDCNESTGGIDIGIYAPSPIISTSWNTGHLTEDLHNIPAGTYTVTALDINGCTGYLEVTVPNKLPYQPSICLLTVDTSLIYNMVVWEKDPAQPVSGFNIYRETPTYGVFELVESRPYGLESFYQDNVASPMDRSWRYYLTTTDACGGESFPSFIHKTIHVVATTSDGTNYDLHWDDYEGISYSSIDLHRYDPTNGWVTIGPNLPFGTHTYADMPPVIAGLDYLVTFNLSDPCTSSKVQDHNSSRSNKSASVFMPGGSTAQIQDTELGYISLFPNPASDLITLHLDKPELFQYYEVRDLSGQLVERGSLFNTNTAIGLDGLSSGIYTLHLISESKIVVQKFVKN